MPIASSATALPSESSMRGAGASTAARSGGGGDCRGATAHPTRLRATSATASGTRALHAADDKGSETIRAW